MNVVITKKPDLSGLAFFYIGVLIFNSESDINS